MNQLEMVSRQRILHQFVWMNKWILALGVPALAVAFSATHII